MLKPSNPGKNQGNNIKNFFHVPSTLLILSLTFITTARKVIVLFYGAETATRSLIYS